MREGLASLWDTQEKAVGLAIPEEAEEIVNPGVPTAGLLPLFHVRYSSKEIQAM